MIILIDAITTMICSTILGFAINKSISPKFNIYFSVLIMSLGTTFIYLISSYSSLYQNLFGDFDVQQNFKTLLLTIFYFLYPLLLFNETIFKKIKVFIITIISLVVYEGLLTALSTIFFDISSIEENNIDISLRIGVGFLEIITYSLMALTILLFFRKKDVKRTPISVLLNFSAIILINCIMIAFIFTSNAYNKDIFTKIILLLSPLLLTALSFSLYHLLIKISDREVLKEKLYWLENVKALELDYYNNLQQKSDEVRRFRHDFKDTLETIKLLVNENSDESIEKAQDILESLNKNINNTKLPVYTNNVVINSVVGAKVDEAQKNNITIHAFLDLPKDLSIESIDLNCVFLNLLNNAIEACKKIPDTANREINLKAAIKAGYLIIKTENSFIEIQKDEKGNIKTTKNDAENHGIGLSLISSIAEKYAGSFETKTENNKFTAIVNLKV